MENLSVLCLAASQLSGLMEILPPIAAATGGLFTSSCVCVSILSLTFYRSQLNERVAESHRVAAVEKKIPSPIIEIHRK